MLKGKEDVSDQPLADFPVSFMVAAYIKRKADNNVLHLLQKFCSIFSRRLFI